MEGAARKIEDGCDKDRDRDIESELTPCMLFQLRRAEPGHNGCRPNRRR